MPSPAMITQPAYQIGTLFKDRTCENDLKALERAKKCLKYIESHRAKGHEDEDEGNNKDCTSPKAVKDTDDGIIEDNGDATSIPPTTDSIPLVSLPLQLQYDEKLKWKKGSKSEGENRAWSGVGFPDDTSIRIEPFEEKTKIDNQVPAVIQLAQDILDIKSKPSSSIADSDFKSETARNRTIETFNLHNRVVVKVTFDEASVGEGGYSNLSTCKTFEAEVNKGVGLQPDVRFEQYVAAHILLCTGGSIGGKTNYLWRKARSLAQQQLHLNPNLAEIAEEQLVANKDNALEEMLKIAKRAIPNSSSNSYHQQKRDQFAVDNSVFYHIKNADIVMVLDKNTNVISFQCNNAIRQLLGEVVQQMIVDAFEKYSTLAAVPLPDITRHGLHWTDFLPQNPQFDPRNPDSDVRKAKSGVYHFGGHCATADRNGQNFGVTPTADSGERLTQWPHVQQQQQHLRYSALGACIEVLKFFFRLLDRELLEEYEKVALEIAKLKNIPFQTRRDIDPFVIKALLVNIMTNEHKDLSDWQFGFAALVPVGDFTGGDLLLRELGLRIEAPSGCIQFMRGRELAHSIAKWEGRRFVVVAATHQAVRGFAQRKMGSTAEGKLPLQRGTKRDHKEVD